MCQQRWPTISFPGDLPGRAWADLSLTTTHLYRRHGFLTTLCQVLLGLVVKAEILLASDEDDGKARAKVVDLGDPLLLHVVERVG